MNMCSSGLVKSIHNIDSTWKLSCPECGMEHTEILGSIPFVCDKLGMTESKFAQNKSTVGVV